MPLIYRWEEVAAMSGARLIRGGATVPARVAIDSRTVQPGDLFVALKGVRQDGHDFLKNVAEQGAAGALVGRVPEGTPPGLALLQAEDPLIALQQFARAHRGRVHPRVVGITGSNGKTTTKEMLSHLLRKGGRTVFFTRGNLNSQIGLPLMLLELNSSHTHAVIEMGASAKGDLVRLAGLARPEIGVITSIGRAHLETFGSVEGVLAAKWELVESLGKEGIAFLNADDPVLMSRRKQAPCPVVTFGLAPDADVRAENLRQDPHLFFDLMVGGARHPVRLPFPGLFNVTNALAAAAVALWERVHLPDVVRGLKTFSPPAQRMQVRRRPDGSTFLIDAYNANPDSMAAGLRSFVSAFPQEALIVVLGSMLELGPAAEPEHRDLGRSLAGFPLERIFFFGPEGEWVRSGYDAAGGRRPFRSGEDRDEIRQEIAGALSSGTAVFFKASRGVRLEEIYEPLLKVSS